MRRRTLSARTTETELARKTKVAHMNRHAQFPGDVEWEAIVDGF